MAPPVKPCSARKAIIESMSQARPHSRLETVKRPAESVNSQRVDSACDRKAGERDHHDLGHQIGGLHPGDLVGPGVQARLDRVQRGGDDLDVEQRHELAERHDRRRSGTSSRPWGGIARIAAPGVSMVIALISPVEPALLYYMHHIKPGVSR